MAKGALDKQLGGEACGADDMQDYAIKQLGA
jgi:hypothetical protein